MLTAMPDDAPDPPRKFYQLKQKEFEIVNAPSGAAAADSTPTHVRGHLRAANNAPLKPAATPPPRENEVHALLRDNLARANAAGLNDLAPPPKRRSRRKRDYFLLLVPVDAFFAYMAFGPGANAATFAYGLGGIALYTCGLTWVMWFVMDDY